MTPDPLAARSLTAEEAMDHALLYVFQTKTLNVRAARAVIAALKQDGYTLTLDADLHNFVAGDVEFRDALILAMVAAGFDGDDNPGESPSHATISWADAIIDELPRWNNLSVRTTGAEYRASDPGNVWVRMSEEDYAKLIAK